MAWNARFGATRRSMAAASGDQHRGEAGSRQVDKVVEPRGAPAERGEAWCAVTDHGIRRVHGLVQASHREARRSPATASARSSPSEKFSARLSIAARATPLWSSDAGSRPTIMETATRALRAGPCVSSVVATAATWVYRLRCAIRLLATAISRMAPIGPVGQTLLMVRLIPEHHRQLSRHRLNMPHHTSPPRQPASGRLSRPSSQVISAPIQVTG